MITFSYNLIRYDIDQIGIDPESIGDYYRHIIRRCQNDFKPLYLWLETLNTDQLTSIILKRTADVDDVLGSTWAYRLCNYGLWRCVVAKQVSSFKCTTYVSLFLDT